MNHPQIEIPREVPHAARMTPRDMRHELALSISTGQAVLW